MLITLSKIEEIKNIKEKAERNSSSYETESFFFIGNYSQKP
jgi:hypothetical protein